MKIFRNMSVEQESKEYIHGYSTCRISVVQSLTGNISVLPERLSLNSINPVTRNSAVIKIQSVSLLCGKSMS